MKKTMTLKDGTDVVIRPMMQEDFDRSFAFFQALPPEDRVFLRTDVTRRDRVERRTNDICAGIKKGLVAISGREIVADGVLELEGHEWKEHVGEIRLFVARSHQRKGLGLLMARELYGLAASEKVEEIVVKMMRPQKAARHIFRRLGFREGIVLPDYVKDLTGTRQDLIVMRCELEELWREMEHYLADSDWQRAR
jgi:L-amino acid N-acyltransferase YncA